MGVWEQDFGLLPMGCILRHARGDVRWRSEERSGLKNTYLGLSNA